jgi:transcriptional regulator with XRE-family HTH domain
MNDGGYRLKRARLRLGLTFRDVERASDAIASSKHCADYFLPISRLSEIENHAAQPTIYRIYSLCAIYRISFAEALLWYNLDLSELGADSERLERERVRSAALPDPSLENSRILRRSLEGIEGLSLQQRPLVAPDGGAGDDSLAHDSLTHDGSIERDDPRQTRLVDLHQIHSSDRHHWSLGEREGLAQAVDLAAPPRQGAGVRYGRVGWDDHLMTPLIPPGSLLQIDTGARRVQEWAWRHEFERPIYFIGHKDGFSCCWCSVHQKTLVIQPHPLSPCSPRTYLFPQQSEVLGQVIGVTMALRSPTASLLPREERPARFADR